MTLVSFYRQRFYRTLSEIKSEVESIIKTGRKMVEDKAVPEPQEFSKKIDMLKELYNKLGAQITESKSRLEYALLTAREIQSDLQALTGWLDGLGAGIGKQTLELEMSRMEAIKDKLNANYTNFASTCDPIEFDDKAPLTTSTPIKQEERSKQSVQVVAMSPKLVGDHLPRPTGDRSPTPTGGQSPKLTGDQSPEIIGDGIRESSIVSDDQSPKLSGDQPTSTDDESGKLLDDKSPNLAGDQTPKSADESASRGGRGRCQQLGQLAPDAAALISQGDSLVYAKHKDNPLLADYIQTHFQDKLRNKWSMVMSEIELKRNLALRAEDNLKELNKILEEAQAWPAGDGDAQDGAEQGAREALLERAAELARELRAEHVGLPERALAALLARAPPAGPEHVTRANRAREAVAALGAMLRAPPLGGRDYDEFPLQEDALARVRAGLGSAAPRVADAERELAWHAGRAGPAAPRALRLLDKLRAEWAALHDAYRQRHD
ncbi:hypothetical protein HW555_007427, partial [Spodoptera exigua]